MTHPELKATFCLPILGVKKNPSSPLYTSLGVITKGTVLEVNVSELGLVTQGGKVIWGECLLGSASWRLMVSDGTHDVIVASNPHWQKISLLSKEIFEHKMYYCII